MDLWTSGLPLHLIVSSWHNLLFLLLFWFHFRQFVFLLLFFCLNMEKKNALFKIVMYIDVAKVKTMQNLRVTWVWYYAKHLVYRCCIFRHSSFRIEFFHCFFSLHHSFIFISLSSFTVSYIRVYHIKKNAVCICIRMGNLLGVNFYIFISKENNSFALTLNYHNLS